MKIFVVTIAILALNVYVTRATSLDPVENARIDEAEAKSDDTRTRRSLDPVENARIDEAEDKSDDTRTKRSGEIFTSLLKKKLALLNTLTAGASSGKSIGPFAEQYEEPLSYNTKSFNLWGVKKAILSSVLQAAKAITGGVIALKGNLITAKGHVVVAKGKLMQTKGQAISSFGKTIATHAFDSQSETPSYEQGGLFNHLPAVPIHQPASYGAATSFGFQQQSYPGRVTVSHAYPSGNGYQVAAPSQFAPTGYGVPQSEYGGGLEYPAYGSGASFSSKRAVLGNTAAQESIINQVKNEFDKDAVRAGLLIFKPIKMPQTLPLSAAATQNVRGQQVVGQRPPQAIDAFPLASSLKSGLQTAFNRFQAASQANGGGNPQAALPANGFRQQPGPTDGFQTAPQTYAGAYSPFQSNGYAAPQSTEYRFPPSAGAVDGGSVENGPGQGFAGPNFADFPPVPGSQEFDRQLSGFSDQQQQQQHQQQQHQQQERQPAFYSRENFGVGGDQHESASGSEEHVVEPVYKHARIRAQPKPESQAEHKSRFAVPPEYFLPTTAAYDDEPSAKYTRSAASPSSQEGAVPLQYHNDGTSAEEQARLKQTVHRFFAMLKNQSCEC